MNGSLSYAEAIGIIGGFLKEYRARYGIKNKALKTHYDIPHQTIEDRLKGKPVSQDRAKAPFIALAREIIADPKIVLRKIASREPLPQALPHCDYIPAHNTFDHDEAVLIINAFLDEYKQYAITDVGLHAWYGIDNSTIKSRLGGGSVRHELVRSLFRAFAQDILRDRQGTLHAVTSKPPLHGIDNRGKDPQSLLRSALFLGTTGDLIKSIKLAKAALTYAAEEGYESLFEVLPGALYCLHRHGSAAILAKTARHLLLPFLNAKRHLSVPRSVAGAAMGQLASALNEGGSGPDAMDVFCEPQVLAISGYSGPLAWCGPMILRNEAHCLVWHEHAVARALDRAEHAASRDRSAANRQSVASTLCNIHLSSGKARLAWQAIEEEYSAVRRRLDTHFENMPQASTGHPFDRVHHSFGVLYGGVCARLSLRDCRYSPGEACRDIEYLEGLLSLDSAGAPHRPLPLDGIQALPVEGLHPQLASRVETISRLAAKPLVSPYDAMTLYSLAKLLASASRS